MVVSSGMQSMATMRQVYKTVKKHNPNFVILQCTSTYPLSPDEVNLRVITVNKRLNLLKNKKQFGLLTFAVDTFITPKNPILILSD